MARISIIMPCFNAETYIARGVESVLGQTFQDIEVIIINDGSTDSSHEIISRFTDQRLKIISQENRGVSASRNRGLEAATGELIAFLDADDTWDRTCLEKLYGALKASPDAAASYCGWQNIGLPGGKGNPYVPPDYEVEGKFEHLLKSCPWPIHAALTRRSAIEEAGQFDERFSNAEDYGMWLKMAWFHRIVRVPEVLAFYYFHEGAQASNNRARAACDHWKVQVEFLKENPGITKKLGRRLVRRLTNGQLLRSGYECYWSRDLESARRIFRSVMSTGYGSLSDWKYMTPALLPLRMHRFLIHLHESK
jgi:glycosyltransferase involved in cell wall biosynthesis